MTRIEGIIAPKKHKTISQKRGEFSGHDRLRTLADRQRQKMMLIAGVTGVVLVITWAILLATGVLYSPTKSDSEFVKSLSNGASQATLQPNEQLTEEEQRMLQETDKALFPEFYR